MRHYVCRLVPAFMLLYVTTVCSAPEMLPQKHIRARLEAAVQLQRQHRLPEAAAAFTGVLEVDPGNSDAMHMLGMVKSDLALAAMPKSPATATVLWEEAVQLVTAAEDHAAAADRPLMRVNLAFILKAKGDITEAIELLEDLLSSTGRPLPGTTHLSTGATSIPLQQQQETPEWEGYALLCLASALLSKHGSSALARVKAILDAVPVTAPSFAAEVERSAILARNRGDSPAAIALLQRAIARITSHDPAAAPPVHLMLELATTYHMAGMLEAARSAYLEVLELEPQHTGALMNYAGLKQQTGDMLGAIADLRVLYNSGFRPPQLLNNMGTCLSLTDQPEEGRVLLEEALALEPNNGVAAINLASLYYEEGLRDKASAMYLRAYAAEPANGDGLLISNAILLSAVAASLNQMTAERAALLSAVQELAARDPPLRLTSFDRVPRVHFNLVYDGLNNRATQEAVSTMYRRVDGLFTGTAPHLQDFFNDPSAPLRQPPPDGSKPRIRVVFVSAFLGQFEPHGMLVAGVVRGLPRPEFEVILARIPAKDRPVEPSLAAAAEDVINLAYNYDHNIKVMGELRADIIVYLEMNSETTTHFLGHVRLAPVQVVLLSGQGIWYDRPVNLAPDLEPLLQIEDDAAFWARKRELVLSTKAQLGMEPDSVLFMSAQAVFKYHPLFDDAIAQLLRRDQRFHVVLQEGQRKTWTQVYMGRLSQTLGPELMRRVHLVTRTNSGSDYLRLIAGADVLLHPFPFGGSRTSTDGFQVGTPVVTMATDQLRGRMAAAFYTTMGLDTEMVCPYDTVHKRHIQCYLDLATKLGQDQSYRAAMTHRIRRNIHLIWERQDVVDEWTSFLRRAHRLSRGGSSTAAAPPAPPPSDVLTHSVGQLHESTAAMAAVHTAVAPEPLAAQSTGASLSGKEHVLLQGSQAAASAAAMSAATSSAEPVLSLPTDTTPAAAADAGEQHVVELMIQLQQLYNLGRVDDALALAAGMEEPYASHPMVLNNIGGVLQAQWKLEEALDYIMRAARADPTSPVYACNTGVVLFNLGRMAEAEPWLRQALALDPSAKQQESQALISLTQVLIDAGRVEEALNLAVVEHMGLPEASRETMVAVVLAVTHLEPQHRAAVLRVSQKLNLKFDLWEAWLRLHQSFISVANSLLGMLERQGWLPNVEVLYSDISGISHAPPLLPQGAGLHLIVQYYKDRSGPLRQAELDLCLRQNAANRHFAVLHLLLEHEADARTEVVREVLQKYGAVRVRLVQLGERATFASMFSYANGALPPGTPFILSNSDVYFDSSLGRLGNASASDMRAKVFALRWWGNGQLVPRVDSQDSWLLTTPVPESVIAATAFPLGVARCDNRLAAVFEEHGFSVGSPSFALRSWHVDAVKPKPSHYGGATQVAGRGAFVPCNLQWQF
ncbi:hypothetical protein JKP88DRAFT_332224 [Tribonema minus]|uniref:protein O-GlcNAc transferase n=1 Tax=Tribonema minus TaxID=303371 RepID=A0A835YUZ8_9STRA|nr:hypothetical protein JKP88DRAFT_332224 [Tribonema minus]